MRTDFACLVIVPALLSVWNVSALAAGDAAPAAGVHEKIVTEYLDGPWDALTGDLARFKPDLAALPAVQKADADYIRRAVLEGRPEWWARCKAGKRCTFRATIWGRTSDFTFDPAAKTNIQLNFVNNIPAITVKWEAADMDNAAEAEHGFSKGELNDLNIWSILGMAESWSAVPPQTQLKLKEDARLLLTRSLDFHANLAGVYYGEPRARRWGLWLGLAAFKDEYAKTPVVMSRRALGAFFMAQVLSRRDVFPSVPLPAELPPTGAEAAMGAHLRSALEKKGFTLPEDEAMRDAVKALEMANQKGAGQSGRITLPNGLFVSLDPDTDKPEAARRERWVREQFDRIAKK